MRDQYGKLPELTLLDSEIEIARVGALLQHTIAWNIVHLLTRKWMQQSKVQ